MIGDRPIPAECGHWKPILEPNHIVDRAHDRDRLQKESESEQRNRTESERTDKEIDEGTRRQYCKEQNDIGVGSALPLKKSATNRIAFTP